MITVYHGAQSSDFAPELFKKSRYGIPVLFFTDNKTLAGYYAKENNIFYATVKPVKKIDFGGEFSHSGKFRNLIFKLYKEGHDVVEIKNIYDRPNDDFPLEKSSIFVVFNFYKILNIKKCTP